MGETISEVSNQLDHSHISAALLRCGGLREYLQNRRARFGSHFHQMQYLYPAIVRKFLEYGTTERRNAQ